MNDIHIKNLRKSYRAPGFINLIRRNKLNKVLDIKSAKFTKNKIYGLVGINGSGKTTLLQILSGLIVPDSGEILFDSENQATKNTKIGYMSSNPRSFYWRLTGRQNLDFYSELLCLDKRQSNEMICDLANQLNVSNKLDVPFRFYSSGEMQSFSLIRSLLNKPDLLLLDEPTSHLDPIASQTLQDVVLRFSKNHEMIIILCSHNLDEVMKLCDHISFLIEGELHRKDLIMLGDNQSSNFIIKIKSTSLETLNNLEINYEILNNGISYVDIRILSIKQINELINIMALKKIEIFSVVKDVHNIYKEII